MKHSVITLLSIALLFNLTIIPKSNQAQDTLYIFPDKDAVISFENPDLIDDDNVMFTASASEGGGEVLRSLIDFNLDTIPDSAYIYSATLILDGLGHDSGLTGNSFKLQRIIEPWVENEVSWSNKPAITSTDEIELPSTDSSSQDYEIDIKLHINDMRTGGADDGFMMMLSNETNESTVEFASSDHGTANVPVIRIIYEIPSELDILVTAGSTNNFDSTDTGFLQCQVTGGIPPYTYSWTDGSEYWTEAELSSLEAGTYTLLVTDDNETELQTEIGLGYVMEVEPDLASNELPTSEYWDPCGAQTQNVGRETPTETWGGGITSANVLPANTDGWVEYTVEASNYDRMFGLTEYGESDGNWENIQYGLFLNKDNDLIKVSNGNQYSLTDNKYQIGDILRIARVEQDIVLSKNGTELDRFDEVGNGEVMAADINIYQGSLAMHSVFTSFSKGYDFSVEINHVSPPSTNNGSIVVTATSFVSGTFSYTWYHEGSNIGSSSSITSLEAGVYYLELTHNSSLNQQTVYRQYYLADDSKMNWELTKIFNRNGDLTGNSKVYFNKSGKVLQTQIRDVTADSLLASQVMYDRYGREIANTLIAPLFIDEFCYQPQFVENTYGQKYDYEDFDLPNYSQSASNLSTGEVDNPAPVSNQRKGTLGWYYSSNNSREKYVAETSFPYSRIEYDNNRLQNIRRVSKSQDFLSMGSGHHSSTHNMNSAGELRKVYGYMNGWAGGNFLLSTESGCGQMITRDFIDEFKPFKTVSYDENQNEHVSFYTDDGLLIAQAYSGTGDNGINQDELNVTSVIQLIDDEELEYVDIHIPEGCEGTLHLQNDEGQPEIEYRILDLTKDQYLETEAGSRIFKTHNPQPYGDEIQSGIYRIIYIKGAENLASLSVSYDLNYYDYTLYYYDMAGRLLAVVPPKGINLYTAQPTLTNTNSPKDLVTDEVGGNSVWGLGSAGVTEGSIELSHADENDPQVFNMLNIFLDTDAGEIGSKLSNPDLSVSSLSNLSGTGAKTYSAACKNLEYSTDIEEVVDPELEGMYCITASSYTEAALNLWKKCGGSMYPHITSKENDIYCLTCKHSPQEFEKVFVIDVSIMKDVDETSVPIKTVQFKAYQYTQGWLFQADESQTNSNIPAGITFTIPHFENEENIACSLQVTNISILKPVLDGEGDWIGYGLEPGDDFSGLEELKLDIRNVVYKLNDDPKHSMYTIYDYNSVDEVLSVADPDRGKTEYTYSKHGLLRFAQDARQRAEATFSYYRYHRDGYHLIENGEAGNDDYKFVNYYGESCQGCTGTSTFGIRNNINYKMEFTPKMHPTFSEVGVIDTNFTDTTGLSTSDYCQRNVYDRVSKTWNATQAYEGSYEYTKSKTWYSYNPDGQIEWVVKRIHDMDGGKTITYDYEYNDHGLVSNVIYQKGVGGEYFEHQYTYNDDQKLIKVETRTAVGTGYDEQAEYKYYCHGPLKRIEVAKDLQGIDYIYNTVGWLKGINSPNLGYNGCYKFKDPGKDGLGGSSFEEDVFGMTIDYFNGDYERTASHVNHGDWDYLDEENAQYNGLIKSTRWNHSSMTLPSPDPTFTHDQWIYEYKYNEKYWLEQAEFGTYDEKCQNLRKRDIGCEIMYDPQTVSHVNFMSDPEQDYKVSDLTYDGNGNLLTLERNAYYSVSPGTVTNMDNFAYQYKSNCSNILDRVDDSYTDANWPDDLDDQPVGNYIYDDAGRMIQDESNFYSTYDPYGQVIEIKKEYTTGWAKLLKFTYDEHGARLSKTEYDSTGSEIITYWYMNNSSGQDQAIYDYDHSSSTLSLMENSIYGIGKIGIRRPGSPDEYQYSLGDHLSNIRTVFSEASGNLSLDEYHDYYPWGMEIPGRTANLGDYDHGYQGQFTEHDLETSYDNFNLRQYDGRLARWMTVDPYRQHHSPYLAMGNNPISTLDPNGGLSWAASTLIGVGTGATVGAFAAVAQGEEWYKGAVVGGVIGGASGLIASHIAGASGMQGTVYDITSDALLWGASDALVSLSRKEDLDQVFQATVAGTVFGAVSAASGQILSGPIEKVNARNAISGGIGGLTSELAAGLAGRNVTGESILRQTLNGTTTYWFYGLGSPGSKAFSDGNTKGTKGLLYVLGNAARIGLNSTRLW